MALYTLIHFKKWWFVHSHTQYTSNHCIHSGIKSHLEKHLQLPDPRGAK